jgi:signal transduction histidine kinase
MSDLTRSVAARRSAARTWLRRALWPLTVAAGLAAESVLWRSGAPPAYVVFDLVVGFTVVAVSFAVWESHPGNRIGPLLFLNSAWFLISPVRYIASPFWISLAWVAQLASSAVFAHMVLAYPSGRLKGRLDASFVVVVYIFGIAYPAAELTVAPAEQLFGGCLTGPCPPMPPFIADAPAAFARMQLLASVIDMVLAAGFLVLVARRLVRSSPPRRRRFLPIAALALVATADFVVETFAPADTGNAWSAATVFDHGVKLAIAFTFFASLYSSRMSRSHLADLLARLAGAESGTVQALLSGLLHDPQLRLGLWDRDRGAYLDTAGGVLDVAPGSPRRVATRVSGSDGPLGVLVHDQALLDDSQLMSAVLAGTRLALENEQLQTRLRARLAEVQASSARLVRAGDEARRQLERDLHDGAQQRLMSIGLALQLARKELPDSSTAAELIDESEGELQAAIDELRNLAHGIHPAVLTEHGLQTAVTALARRLAIPVELSVTGGRMPASAETTAYFLICEALQNTVKHARASRATVAVAQQNGRVLVEVTDDGVGGADPASGSGLRGLADRVEAVGGRLSIESPASQGTTVRAELPCG